MATYLVCSSPIHGHVSPMLAIGRHLAASGHRVIMLTGSRFDERVSSAGIEFRALRGNADIDDRGTFELLPDRAELRGLAQVQFDIQRIFVEPIAEQARSVSAILAADGPAAVVTDSTFAGVAPLMLDPGAVRPPIVAIGLTPLPQASRDVAPYGMALPPSSSAIGRLRNRALNAFAQRMLFRRTQRIAQQAFAEVGDVPLSHFVLDTSRAFDHYLQLNTALFEYPRSDLSPNVRFVGPLPPAHSSTPLPSWWADLNGSRPVVHVTQGTIDNHDLDRLIRPTISALADSEVLLVVSLGGGDASALGRLPENVRVADYLPYDRLFPLTDVFVTNGGFGGVQHALGYGVPLVVAGGTEDKPEVAARVGWAGVGVNLRTGTPPASAVKDAVARVLADPAYRDRARAHAAAIAECSPFETIDRVLVEAVALRHSSPTTPPSAE